MSSASPEACSTGCTGPVADAMAHDALMDALKKIMIRSASQDALKNLKLPELKIRRVLTAFRRSPVRSWLIRLPSGLSRLLPQICISHSPKMMCCLSVQITRDLLLHTQPACQACQTMKGDHHTPADLEPLNAHPDCFQRACCKMFIAISSSDAACSHCYLAALESSECLRGKTRSPFRPCDHHGISLATAAI